MSFGPDPSYFVPVTVVLVVLLLVPFPPFFPLAASDLAWPFAFFSSATSLASSSSFLSSSGLGWIVFQGC
jgi:hypothetical protein